MRDEVKEKLLNKFTEAEGDGETSERNDNEDGWLIQALVCINWNSVFQVMSRPHPLPLTLQSSWDLLASLAVP